MSSPIELEVAFLVWEDKDGNEQITPAHTFPSGTSMLFQQAAAPVGWTRATHHNDKAIRITNGTVSTGGHHPFNTVFGKTSTNDHTLSSSQVPSHNHNATGSNWNYTGAFAPSNLNRGGTFSPGNRHVSAWWNLGGGIGASGGGGGHSHTMDIRVAYVDVLIAIKD